MEFDVHAKSIARDSEKQGKIMGIWSPGHLPVSRCVKPVTVAPEDVKGALYHAPVAIPVTFKALKQRPIL